MVKNKNLKKFYDNVYSKGEKKHYTHFVVNKKPSSEALEVSRITSWKNKSVLDVGCGTGNFCSMISKKGTKRVVGIDYASEAIKIAKKEHKSKNLEFRNIQISQIDEKFDVIVSIGTLEHMDNPYEILKVMKKKLNANGKIIITNPNWTNPRGYILMTLYHLFKSPITLADIHYFTPMDHFQMAKKINMKLKWKTIDESWASGKVLINDFKRRIPNVIKDSKLPSNKKRIDELIRWLNMNVIPMNNKLKHSGAIGVYIYSKK